VAAAGWMEGLMRIKNTTTLTQKKLLVVVFSVLNNTHNYIQIYAISFFCYESQFLVVLLVPKMQN
jgi:hypothetical protein